MSGAISLIIETSTSRASLAVADESGILEQREFVSDRNHNSLLFAPLREILGVAGRPAPALVLVGSGPGSYSGTRVGIAAAQGVAMAVGCPAVAVPSILAVPATDGGGPCLAIGDARRGAYWWAEISGMGIAQEPQLGDANALRSVVERASSAGATVLSFEDPARFPLPEDLRDRVSQEFPDAARLWRAWLRTVGETRQQWAGRIPQPLYLKPPHITVGKRGGPVGAP